MPIQIISESLNITMNEAGKFWAFLCKMLQPAYALELVQTRSLVIQMSYEQFKLVADDPTDVKTLVNNSLFGVVAPKGRSNSILLKRAGDELVKADFKDDATTDKAVETLKKAADNVVSFADFKKER